MSDYSRIEKAMIYMSEHVSEQPTLEAVAAHVHLSPFHFQRVFCRWAGTTPKRFASNFRAAEDETTLLSCLATPLLKGWIENNSLRGLSFLLSLYSQTI